MPEWNKTYAMRNRLASQGKIEVRDGRDFYKGRPIIHRDSEVDGGVYLGASEREAIVVDSQKYLGLRKLYQTAKAKASIDENVRKNLVLEAVFQTVKEAMPKQDEKAVEELVKKYGAQNDCKINLDVFLDEGTGVCRHDALACAATLELFKKEGIITGKPSVDRNSDSFDGKVQGHAWCRHLNSIGQVFILDVAQNFIGRLEKAPDKNRWAYERPEDF